LHEFCAVSFVGQSLVAVHDAVQALRNPAPAIHVSVLLVWADSRQRQRSSRKDILQNKPGYKKKEKHKINGEKQKSDI
jgi:hypothetical protein